MIFKQLAMAAILFFKMRLRPQAGDNNDGLL